MKAQRNFKSQVPPDEVIDYRKFWNEYLPGTEVFKERPELVSALLFNQQLAIITGNYQPLIEDLQVTRKISSVADLFAIEDRNWQEIITKTGIPAFITGAGDEEKTDAYCMQIRAFLNAAFPSMKIAKMVKNHELPIPDAEVSASITAFLESNPGFDFKSSGIHEFSQEIGNAASGVPEEYPHAILRHLHGASYGGRIRGA